MNIDEHDLLFARDVARFGGDPRELRNSRELIRVRRGVYCARDTWDAIDSRQRHLLRIRASMPSLTVPGMFAGVSAAAVWDIPILGDWPTEVTLLSPYRGGGKSEPGVLRTSVSAASATSAAIDGIPVTTLARTGVDLARTNVFGAAVASVDAIVARVGASFRDDMRVELLRMNLRAGTARALRVLDVACDNSGSYGESRARAAIIDLGFDAPETQVEFRDEIGAMYPDFYWRGVNIAGEFDGKTKYTRDEFAHGDPAEVVWKEKKREDRLRRQVRTVVRIHHQHVENPPMLSRMLAAAGIPRR